MPRRVPSTLAFLSLSENRDTFFRRVHEFVLPYHDGAVLIANAYKEAKAAFDGVKRKRGERYFEHCRGVALIVMDILGIRDADVVAAALLHDILEDCSETWNRERLLSEFGPRVTALVVALSIPEGAFTGREERMAAYHAQLLAGPPETIPLKLADRLHNLWTSGALSRAAQERMIEETERDYLPLARARGILWKELRAIIKERKRVLRCARESAIAVSAP